MRDRLSTLLQNLLQNRTHLTQSQSQIPTDSDTEDDIYKYHPIIDIQTWKHKTPLYGDAYDEPEPPKPKRNRQILSISTPFVTDNTHTSGDLDEMPMTCLT